MSAKQSRWVLWGLGLACTACCVLPLYNLLGGAAIGFAVGMILPATKEILLCALPWMVVGLVIYTMKRKKRICCDTLQSTSNNQQCEVKHHA